MYNLLWYCVRSLTMEFFNRRRGYSILEKSLGKECTITSQKLATCARKWTSLSLFQTALMFIRGILTEGEGSVQLTSLD
jgi:hypothetical protein